MQTKDIVECPTTKYISYQKEPTFSPISGDIDDDMLMRRQIMSVSADGKYFGTFFLESWTDVFNDGTTFNFNAKDALGVMDGYRFMGDIYENVNASSILQDIVDTCFPTGIIQLEIDSELDNKLLSGHIPPCTARKALQYVCFAMGAVADTSRKNSIMIYTRDTEKKYDIARSEMYAGGKNEPTEYFSGIDLSAYEYAKTNDSQEIYNDVLPEGTHEFEFSEPLHSLVVVGAMTGRKERRGGSCNFWTNSPELRARPKASTVIVLAFGVPLRTRGNDYFILKGAGAYDGANCGVSYIPGRTPHGKTAGCRLTISANWKI